MVKHHLGLPRANMHTCTIEIPSSVQLDGAVIQEGIVAARVRAVHQNQQGTGCIPALKNVRRFGLSRLTSDTASFQQEGNSKDVSQESPSPQDSDTHSMVSQSPTVSERDRQLSETPSSQGWFLEKCVGDVETKLPNPSSMQKPQEKTDEDLFVPRGSPSMSKNTPKRIEGDGQEVDVVDRLERQPREWTDRLDQFDQETGEQVPAHLDTTRDLPNVFLDPHENIEPSGCDSLTTSARHDYRLKDHKAGARNHSPATLNGLRFAAPAAPSTHLDRTTFASQRNLALYDCEYRQGRPDNSHRYRMQRRYHLPTIYHGSYHNSRKRPRQDMRPVNDHHGLNTNDYKSGKVPTPITKDWWQHSRRNQYAASHWPRSSDGPKPLNGLVMTPSTPLPIYMSPSSTGRRWTWRKHAGKHETLSNSSRILVRQADDEHRISSRNSHSYTLGYGPEGEDLHGNSEDKPWSEQGISTLAATEESSSELDSAGRQYTLSESEGSVPSPTIEPPLNDRRLRNKGIQIISSSKAVHVNINKRSATDDQGASSEHAEIPDEEVESRRQIVITVKAGSDDVVRIEVPNV